MTGHRTNIVRRFPRERVAKLFSQLGSDNKQEAETARNGIDAVLHQFGKAWPDLIELLLSADFDDSTGNFVNKDGRRAAIRAGVAHDIIALGSRDPDERANARRKLADLLERHRKGWNDLVNALCGTSHEAWACDPPAADPIRVNPLELVFSNPAAIRDLPDVVVRSLPDRSVMNSSAINRALCSTWIRGGGSVIEVGLPTTSSDTNSSRVSVSLRRKAMPRWSAPSDIRC